MSKLYNVLWNKDLSPYLIKCNKEELDGENPENRMIESSKINYFLVSGVILRGMLGVLV